MDSVNNRSIAKMEARDWVKWLPAARFSLPQILRGQRVHCIRVFGFLAAVVLLQPMDQAGIIA